MISRGGWKRQGRSGKSRSRHIEGAAAVPDWNAMYGEAHPLFATAGQQIGRHLPSFACLELAGSSLISSMQRNNDVAKERRCGLLVLAALPR
jgi:hypothetical protein